ncbi:MAG: heme NO-binding domain-containing protein [Magnetococcales bacterium]|nr:heme NO-binding domain-containing protein [Magnetococcales bacterium]
MHGFFFHKLKRFTEDRLGAGRWAGVMAAAELAKDDINPSLTYPREDFNKLLAQVATGLNQPVPEAMEAFGQFLAPSLIEIGGLLGLIQPYWKTLDLIENLKQVIHAALHSINPQVNPPDIRCVRVRANQVALAYQSPRRMCALLKGVVQGVARHYGDEVSIQETACMLRHRPLCRINVTLLDAEPTQQMLGASREIKEILRHGGDIKLFNLYKGVPISYPAMLLKSKDDTILVKACKTQLIATQAEGSTYISSPVIDVGLRGRVTQIDWKKQTIVLDTLTRSDGAIGERVSLRVEPEGEIPVALTLAGKKISGLLQDLSMTGMSLSVDGDQEIPEDELYTNIEITFSLSLVNWDPFIGEMEQRQVDLAPSGDLLAISRKGTRQTLRISFADLSSQDLASLEQYIMQIQLNVLRDLRERIQ